MNDSIPPKKSVEDTDEKKEVIKEKDIGKVRHDEPVTAKGIARALLMADEPEQRMEVDHSDKQTDSKSKD